MYKKLLLAALILLVTTACQQVGPTEVGVRFRKLPSGLGPLDIGGLSTKIVAPGQLAVLMPWDSLFVLDTAVKDISWPSTTMPEDFNRKEGFVNTRALDGNEVALAVTVRYRVVPEGEEVLKLVMEVARNDREVRDLVASIARADIRTHMNDLRTAQFLDEKERYAAIDRVKDSMGRRLNPLGIQIDRVILDDFRFERLLKDEAIDASYQERLTEIQKLREDTEREKSRIETVKAKKQQEFNTVLATVNRIVEEAEGYKKQAGFRGDAYLQSRQNEAQGILALGKSEAEGLEEQVRALASAGGISIFRLSLAKALKESNAKFYIVNGGSSDLGLRTTDTNELLKQLGSATALAAKARMKSEASAETEKQE